MEAEVRGCYCGTGELMGAQQRTPEMGLGALRAGMRVGGRANKFAGAWNMRDEKETSEGWLWRCPPEGLKERCCAELRKGNCRRMRQKVRGSVWTC